MAEKTFIKVKYSLDDFRKKENFEKYFPGCIIRIRESKKDLIYYNGNKAFEVSKDKDKKYIDFSFPINTYQCNTSDVQKDFNNKLKERLIETLQQMEVYFKFKMSSITFQYATKVNEKKVQEKLQKFKDFLEIKKVSFEYDEKSNSKKFKFNDLEDIQKIIDIQYEFLKVVRLTEVDGKLKDVQDTIRDVKFDFKAIEQLEYSIEEVSKFDSQKSFFEIVKKSLTAYEGTPEKEKKYQFQFMLNGDKTNIFENEKKSGISIKYFEQEYGITNKERKVESDNGGKKQKDGRVDCVFYGIDEKSQKLTDIYLIELKVDEGVILGSNGVLTHLDDIYSFVQQRDKFDELMGFIKYRIETLDKIQDIEVEHCKIHFYTIVGFTKEDSRELVKEAMKKLEDENSINELITKGNLPNYFSNDKIYSETRKTTTIYAIMNKLKDLDVDVKFFYEKELWNKENFGTIFEDKTHEIYPKTK